MMKKILLLSALSLLFFGESTAQDFPGYGYGNYAGVHGVYHQPASIADSRFKFDLNLFGLHVGAGNNYFGFNREKAWDQITDDPLETNTNLLSINRSTVDKMMYSDLAIYIPSFMLTLSEKHAFAFTSRARTKFHIDNVDNDLATLITEQFEYPTLWGKSLQNSRFNIQNMVWSEYALTYARVITDKREHFLKAGITPKLVRGAGAFYLFAEDLRYMVSNSDTLTIFDSYINYGHSDNFEITRNEVSYQANSSPGFALDIGVVYEWRPKYQDSKFEMDGEKDLWRRDRNKYKLKLGAALTDLGSIRFAKGPISHNFRANINNWNIQDIQFNSVESFDDTIRARFAVDPSESHFSMKLPTAISFQADYNIWKGFYLNFTPYYAMKFKNTPHKVHGISALTLTPRWESKWLGFYLPATINEYGHANMGLDFMFGPFIVGTNDLLSYVAKKDIYALDLHLFARIPLHFNKIKDRDLDKVSNRKDKCIDVPGVWEFMGCPDRDGDHVQDNVDNCPDEFGLVENNGCPDRDGDSVVDKLDVCPDVPGPAESNGCPDKDGDGIVDQDDRCPDQPGIPEMQGCADTDNDQVADYEDLCPEKPGPAYNLGCPETRLLAINSSGEVVGVAVRNAQGQFVFENLPSEENLLFRIEGEDTDFVFEVKVKEGNREKTLVKRKDGYFTFEKLSPDELAINPMDAVDVSINLKKEEEDILLRAFRDLQFDTGKDVIREESFSSLDRLAGLLKQNTDWRLKLTGHTDNTGNYTINMILSKKRAHAVMKYLVAKGVPSEQIDVFYLGDTKPMADNSTEAGRAQNRRVEMKIIR